LLRGTNGYTGGIFFIGGGGVIGNAGIGFSIGNYTEGMRLTSTGNLLINTTTDAGFKLDVNGSFRAGSNSSSNALVVNTTGAVTIRTSSGNTGLTINDSSNGILALTGSSQTYRFVTLGGSQRFEIRDFTNADTTRFAITSAGNVGIGTASPTYKLQVAGGVKISNSNDTISMGLGESSSNSVFVGSLTNHLLKFVVYTNEYARITTSGNVLIGTTTDGGHRLHVEGDTNTSGIFRVGGVAGYTGTIFIAINPPGQQNISVVGGIITNVS
jgi:hypothetical protein